MEKNLDSIPKNKMTIRDQCKIDKDKAVYKEWLIDICESYIMRRRAKIRQKQIDEILKNCHISKPYEERNQYIEKKLEWSYLYFNNLNDVDSEMSEKDQLRKIIELKKKQMQKRSNRLPKEMVLSMLTSDQVFYQSSPSANVSDN